MTKLAFVDIPEMVLPEKMKDFHCVNEDFQKLIEEFNSKIKKVNESKNIREMEELNEFYKENKMKYFDKIELNKAALLEMFAGDEDECLEFMTTESADEKNKEFLINKIIEKTTKNLILDENLKDMIIYELRNKLEKELFNNKSALKHYLKEGLDKMPEGEKAGFQITEGERLINKKGKRFSSVNNKFLEEYGEMIWNSIKEIDINLIRNKNMIAAYEDSKK